jgi:hypothetical protein
MMATNNGHQLELHCWVIGRRIRSFAKSGDAETIAQKTALILASQFGALFDYGTLLLSFFYFKTGANELVTFET